MPQHRHQSDEHPASEDARAVEEARAVLASHWPQWAVRHGLDPVPELLVEEPRVDLFGLRPAEFHVVATIRFRFDADGTTFRGLARGPRTAGQFEVRRDIETPPARRPRRWRRH